MNLRETLSSLRWSVKHAKRVPIDPPSWTILFFYSDERSRFAVRMYHGSREGTMVLAPTDVETRGKSHWLRDNTWRLSPLGVENVEAAIRRVLEQTASRQQKGEQLGGAQVRPRMSMLDEVVRGGDPFPVIRDFYASRGPNRQKWLNALDTLDAYSLQQLARIASDYGSAAGVELKDTIVDLLRQRAPRLGASRKSDLLRNQETPRVLGYELDRETLTPLRQKIDMLAPGDYGADPLGDGLFRMVPSGDIVDLEERNRRLPPFRPRY